MPATPSSEGPVASPERAGPAGRLAVPDEVRRLRVGEPPSVDAMVVDRVAARAVIARADELLMVHSSVAGDYKFPGGGLEPGESLAEAVAREVLEECGRRVARFGDLVLVVEEHRPGNALGRVLRMSSVYLECEVGPVERAQQLDEYERELGFESVWVAGAEALRVNEALLARGMGQPWTAREVAVLRQLAR